MDVLLTPRERYISQVREGYRRALPFTSKDLGEGFSMDELLYIEFSLMYCEMFLAHEPPSIALVAQLLANHETLIDWREPDGRALYPTLLRLIPEIGSMHLQGMCRRYMSLEGQFRVYDIEVATGHFTRRRYADHGRVKALQDTFVQPAHQDPRSISLLDGPTVHGETGRVKAAGYRNSRRLEVEYTIPWWLRQEADKRWRALGEKLARKETAGYKQPITINFDELVKTAMRIDREDKAAGRKSQNLAARCRKIQTRFVRRSQQGQLTISNTDVLDLDTLIHMIGKPSSGKSTLVQLLLVTLAEKGYRVAVITDSTQAAHSQAERYRALGIESTAWCSNRNRGSYGRRIYAADEHRIPCQTQPPETGSLGGGCLLRSMGHEQLMRLDNALVVPPGPEDGICLSLETRIGDKVKTVACPLASLCPHFEQERAVRKASLLFITAVAWARMTPSGIFFPEYQSVSDYLTDEVDLVVIDEADGVQRSLDAQFTLEIELYGRQSWSAFINADMINAIRERSDGGANEKLETCINLGKSLESFTRYMCNIQRELCTTELGKRILDNPFNELSLGTSLLYYLRYSDREALAREDTQHQALLSNLNQMLEMSSILSEKMLKAKPEDRTRGFAKNWLDKLYGDRLPGDRAMALAFWRLLNCLGQGGQYTSDARQDKALMRYAEELWNEEFNSSSLLGGFSPLREYLNSLLPKGESRAEVESKLKQREHDAIKVICCMALARLVMSTLHRVSLPAQVLSAEEVIEGNGLADIARMKRKHRINVPASLLKEGNVLQFDAQSDRQFRLRCLNMMGPGRALFRRLPTAHAREGRPGPHVLVLSGTSYGGNGFRLKGAEYNDPDVASPTYDVPFDVNYILEQPEEEQQVIREKAIFKPVNFEDDNGNPLRVSGTGLDMRHSNAAEIARRLLSPAKPGLPSPVEDDIATSKRAWGSSLVQGRRRILLVLSSYEMVREVLAELDATVDRRWTLVGIRPDDFKLGDRKHHQPSERCHWLCAGDVEAFGGFDEFSVLLAPINVIARGHNILSEAPLLGRQVAGIGYIYFLTRNLPHPGDKSMLTGFHNRALMALAESCFAALAKPGDTTLTLMRRIRTRLSRRYRRALLDDQPFRAMSDETRLRFLYEPLTQIWQTICRGVRGGVPVLVGFVDSAFYPKTAKGGEDDAGTSLLLGIEQLLAGVCDPEHNPNSELARRMFDAPAQSFGEISNKLKALAETIERERLAGSAFDGEEPLEEDLDGVLEWEEESEDEMY